MHIQKKICQHSHARLELEKRSFIQFWAFWANFGQNQVDGTFSESQPSLGMTMHFFIFLQIQWSFSAGTFFQFQPRLGMETHFFLILQIQS